MDYIAFRATTVPNYADRLLATVVDWQVWPQQGLFC